MEPIGKKVGSQELGCLGIFNEGEKIYFVLLKIPIIVIKPAINNIKVGAKVFTQRFNQQWSS